jgi:hypothetical protein
MVAAAAYWERLVVLAPAFMLGAGIVGGALILLGRAFASSVRESGHGRLIAVGMVGLVGLVAFLTYLGVSLPRE